MTMMVALMVLSATSAGAPEAKDIEAILQRQGFCIASIDGCIDENGQQVHPNGQYEVSNITCRKARRPDGTEAAAVKRSMRCGFEVRQTSWLNDQQVGKARHRRMTEIFDLLSFDTTDEEQKPVRSEFWHQRRAK